MNGSSHGEDDEIEVQEESEVMRLKAELKKAQRLCYAAEARSSGKTMGGGVTEAMSDGEEREREGESVWWKNGLVFGYMSVLLHARLAASVCECVGGSGWLIG